jgi:hypothetical protein
MNMNKILFASQKLTWGQAELICNFYSLSTQPKEKKIQ